MMPKKIPLAEPCLSSKEWQYVKECLDSGWISASGPFVEKFERKVMEYIGSDFAVGVTNGTSALHLSLILADVNVDSEVIMPALTFVAPANAIRYVCAHPVFMDVDPNTLQMDVNKLGEFLSKKCVMNDNKCINKETGRHIKAIILVHILGYCCDFVPIIAIARQYGLKVIEDCAEAIGVNYKGTHVGLFGDLSALSFNGNKVVTAGGGGMIITSNKEYASRARYLSTQAKDDALEYIHHDIGYNYRLSNLHAAIGLAQMEQVEMFIDNKRKIAKFYEESFRDIGILLMPKVDYCTPTYWLYTIFLKEGCGVDYRKMVIDSLRTDGIEARPLWHPIHTLPPFKNEQAYYVENATRLYERAVCLPSSVNLKFEDAAKVVSSVKKVLQ